MKYFIALTVILSFIAFVIGEIIDVEIISNISFVIFVLAASVIIYWDSAPLPDSPVED